MEGYTIFLLNLSIVFQVTESRKQEHHLVATVGKFTVIEDFRQMKSKSIVHMNATETNKASTAMPRLM